jgi:hypothetical protein|mmetsp:Transcript_19339/g.32379  ORF Transcript_19339/g.32379 Transcript_19339/m.32379 type:complete len:110 (+) Transcript_19339:62-391(+)
MCTLAWKQEQWQYVVGDCQGTMLENASEGQLFHLFSIDSTRTDSTTLHGASAYERGQEQDTDESRTYYACILTELALNKCCNCKSTYRQHGNRHFGQACTMQEPIFTEP